MDQLIANDRDFLMDEKIRLEAENAKLREDKARLDWLEQHASAIRVLQRDERFFLIPPTRDAIDATAAEMAAGHH